MKIYIIGPSGSGKTTLAKRLSEKYGIESFELDLLVYDDHNNHIKRSDDVITMMFNELLKKDSWIIEDVGRDRFKLGRTKADIIYYVKLSKLEVFRRVNRRWFFQRIGKEEYNYPPTMKQLIDSNKIAYSYLKKEKDKLNSLMKYKDKIKYLNKKDLILMKK